MTIKRINAVKIFNALQKSMQISSTCHSTQCFQDRNLLL